MTEIDDIKRRAGIVEVSRWDTPEFNRNKYDADFLTSLWLDEEDPNGKQMALLGVLGIDNKHKAMEMVAKIALRLKEFSSDQEMMNFLKSLASGNYKL